MTLEQMLNRTIVYHKEIDEKIREAMKVATEAAIKAAADATPPLGESNRTTGNLKKHWEEDSVTEAVKEGNVYKTVLANNVPYASYVNDGHRMDRHFVPGLFKTEDGLEYVPSRRGGIMVGTKTQYVPGLFMTDKAQDAFDEAIEKALENIWEDL